MEDEDSKLFNSGDDGDDVEEEEEIPIRERLSHMSMEELQQLKEKLGIKIFDEAMFGPQKTKKKSARKEKVGWRVRKSLPLELSSKVRPRRVLPVVAVKKKPVAIDPRFDNLYGSFDPEEFKQQYGFIDNVKKDELEHLQKEMEDETDVKEKKRIKFAVTKLENEFREKGRLAEKKKREEEIHKAAVKALEQGKKPVYYNKFELRSMELVEKFERMKEKDKVEKSITKQRLKNATKNRKKIDVKGLSR